jgi:hypothetical protein
MRPFAFVVDGDAARNGIKSQSQSGLPIGVWNAMVAIVSDTFDRTRKPSPMRARHLLFLPVAILWCAPLPAWSQSTGQVRILTPKAMSNHMIDVSLYAPLGRSYEIDASPDLKSWSFATSGIVGDTATFVDGNAPQFSKRFYRASLDWTIMVPNTYLIFTTNSGVDGRVIAYPYTWNTNRGSDGRLIAWPPGWSTNQGRDGRLIAYPSGWTTTNGPDGRLVAFPTNGCTLVTNNDGRITVHPASGLAGAGTNAYVLADWKFSPGGDGRQAAFPVSNFLTNEGGDGRLVGYVSTGWSTVHGPDGRAVAYPVADFTTNTPTVSGRIIAFPGSGWSTAQGIDGRAIAYPTLGNTSTMELDFEDQQLFAFIGHLRTVLGDPDFENYIIYTFFGAGEQRFAD